MKATALLLCALCLSSAWVAHSAKDKKTPGTAPGDSSIGLSGYDSTWVPVAGPDPNAPVKRVIGIAKPPITDSLKQALEEAEIPFFLPVNSFSNTSAGTNASNAGHQVAFSSGATNLNATSHGKAEAWAYGKGSVQSGLSVCGRAVSNAFTNTCGKGNAVIAISSAAEVCANAVAKLYVDSLAKATASKNANACAFSAGIANVTAQQVAVAMADAVALATTPCASAAAYVRSDAFASAVVGLAAQAFSQACAYGEGLAYTQGTGMAQAMAYGYAKALTQAMSKACACSNCGCVNAPKYFSDSAFSNTIGNTAAGKYAILSAVGNAGALFCKGGSMQTSVQLVIDTTVKVYANVLTQLNTLANIETKSPTGAYACSVVAAAGKASAVAEAMGQSIAGALSLNFQKSCGYAVSGINGNAMAKNMAEVITTAFSQTCAEPYPYQQCVPKDGKTTCYDVVGSKEATIANVTNKVTNSPTARSIAKALSILKNKCKCQGNCWCGSGDRCSVFKTCPAFTVVKPTYQPPCVGKNCPPSKKPLPAPTVSPTPGPADCDQYSTDPKCDPSKNPPASAASPSPAFNVYGSTQKPL